MLSNKYFFDLDLTEEQEHDVPQLSNVISIDDLPFYCKLIIISKLATQEICNLSMTSRHWREVCGDQVLWRELLYRDMIKWHSIGHKSYPLDSCKEYCRLASEAPASAESMLSDVDITSGTSHDLHTRLCCQKNSNYKALYFHSAYQRHKDAELIGVVSSAPNADKEYDNQEDSSLAPPTEQQLASNQSFARFMRNLWMRMRSGDGDVIMLGPGLESPNTSKVFRRLLWARQDLLITQRLLPGSQDGVGSGVELDFKGTKRFNLIALYSGNHRERKRRFGLERLLNSNVVEPVYDDSASGESEESGNQGVRSDLPSKFKLCEVVHNFLQQKVDTYRLIYVVDATKGQPINQITCNQFELTALLEGLRSFENQVTETRRQARNENRQRHASADNAAVAFSSLINFSSLSSSSNNIVARRPLLVLCCVRDRTVERISCVEIAFLLDLASITDRPWYVQDVTVDNLNGLESGLEWLFKYD